MKKAVIGTVVLGVVIAAGFIWYSKREKPLEVELVEVKRGEVRATVSNTRAGTVDACTRARMSPMMGGKIAALPVREGDRVERDQILLELWNEDLRAQMELAKEERTVAVAHAEEACATAVVARREASRFESLRAQQLTSEERADLAVGEADARSAACLDLQNHIWKRLFCVRLSLELWRKSTVRLAKWLRRPRWVWQLYLPSI